MTLRPELARLTHHVARPVSFQAGMATVQTAGVDRVEFDRDAETIDALAAFGW